MQIKDYLTVENQRNVDHAQLYTDMVRYAYGMDEAVIIGHHITFEANGDLKSEREIPSADALIFDHTVMGRIFGDEAISIMMNAASLSADTGERDHFINSCFRARQQQGDSPYVA